MMHMITLEGCTVMRHHHTSQLTMKSIFYFQIVMRPVVILPLRQKHQHLLCYDVSPEFEDQEFLGILLTKKKGTVVSRHSMGIVYASHLTIIHT